MLVVVMVLWEVMVVVMSTIRGDSDVVVFGGGGYFDMNR